MGDFCSTFDKGIFLLFFLVFISRRTIKLLWIIVFSLPVCLFAPGLVHWHFIIDLSSQPNVVRALSWIWLKISSMFDLRCQRNSIISATKFFSAESDVISIVSPAEQSSKACNLSNLKIILCKLSLSQRNEIFGNILIFYYVGRYGGISWLSSPLVPMLDVC